MLKASEVPVLLNVERLPGRRSDAYDAAYCRRLNQTLASAFVVVHASPIYVDRGNSELDPWEAAWASIGVRLDSNTAGFATLEEARAYLRLMHSDRSTSPTGAE